MSASAIAAARHGREQDRRAGNVAERLGGSQGPFGQGLPNPAKAGSQDLRLREALIALCHPKGLALPAVSTFEELIPEAVDVPLIGRAAQYFAEHNSFSVPRDDNSHSIDTIHCFVIHEATRLNQGLREWAMLKEGKATAARHDILHRSAMPSQIHDLGNVVSNRGGYQSQADLFQSQKASRVPVDFDSGEVSGNPNVRELHFIASEAVNVCGRTPLRAIQPGCAWLNVNRGDDTNVLHTHLHGHLSGTYYVSSGQEPGPASMTTDGCLIFRAGGALSHATTHSFMRVLPVPGHLWLFPGNIPHVVMGCKLGMQDGALVNYVPDMHNPFIQMTQEQQRQANTLRDARREDWSARISIAMNFNVAAAPPCAHPSVVH